jgi:hypothetical protein
MEMGFVLCELGTECYLKIALEMVNHMQMQTLFMSELTRLITVLFEGYCKGKIEVSGCEKSPVVVVCKI